MRPKSRRIPWQAEIALTQNATPGVKKRRGLGVAGSVRTRLILGSLPALVLLLGHTAHALPGTHAPAISTYDTRASSVVLAYRHGVSDAGPFNTFSYNANFTNTTGKLSAQFGLHYVNFAPKTNNETAHGVGASGVALFEFPVAARWDDGVPKAALAFYVGSVPTIYVSGERNYLTIPLTLGFAVPLSPHKAITFTPWFEVAPSANLDTVFKPADVQIGSNVTNQSPECSSTDPAVLANCKVTLNQSAIEDAVKKGVTADLSFKVPLRAGLEAGIHLGPTVDFNLYTALGALGGGFSGSSVVTIGGGLVFRWDDIVPAVLPVEKRLDREGCDAIESRFRSCPSSRQWLTPEQRARLPQAQTSAPVTPAALSPKPIPTPIAPKPVAAPPVPAPAAPSPTPAPEPPAPTQGQSAPPTTTAPGSSTAAFPNPN